MPDAAYNELTQVLESITLDDLKAQWLEVGTVGVQKPLNQIIRARLTTEPYEWTPEVALFEKDAASDKGVWTMDFAKRFNPVERVGVEVTFNHAEALAWTVIRVALAHEAEQVERRARISCGAIIIATDQLKQGRSMTTSKKMRMDGAVGTYERLRTMLPKMRYYVHIPLVIFGLRWADGGHAGAVDHIDLHEVGSGLDRF